MNKKTVLITGANKGIGLETARILAKNGYHVILGVRNIDLGQQAKDQLATEGFTETSLLTIDTSSEDSVKAAAAELTARQGSLDVLINNAGILGKVPQQATEIADEDIKAVFETNFFGVIRTCREFLPLLKQSHEPRIVNVTSDLGSLTLHNDPTWRHYKVKSAAYGPSKSALNAYTVVLAYELKDTNFKVNLVNPGYTKTEFNNNMGTKDPVEAGALVAEYAMLDANGPTGKYMSDYGESPW